MEITYDSMMRFAEAWVSAWNRRDVDAVLSHYADEAEFVSPVARNVVGRPVLRSKKELEQYWRATLERIPSLEFKLDHGTVDHTPVYPREVVKRALELSSTAVILVHNHPPGDPTPSQADIAMTKEIIAVASTLGIAVHDHIIVGKDGHASLKGLKLL